MVLPRKKAVVPSRIGGVHIELFTPGAGSQKTAYARASIEVFQDDGSKDFMQIELPDHFTNPQLKLLNDFIGYVRSRAEIEVLPLKEGTIPIE